MTKQHCSEDFINGMPKAELHLHIEGTLEPEMMFEMAERNKVSLPYSSVDELKNAYNFSNLQDFLDIYYQGTNVLLNEQDFYDLTYSYLTKAHAENVVHAEVFFDPQTHTTRGISFPQIICGITSAISDARNNYGISVHLIMCFLRHLPEASALKTLEESLPYRDKIIAVGLDSSELGYPPSGFRHVFQKAREVGFLTVAHAGEEGPAEYISEALDILKVSRIDHGNNSLEDEQLVDRLVRLNMPLTLCPLSNLRLKVVSDMKNYPLRIMMERGMLVTINSDDPAYFGGYINANYLAIANSLHLSCHEIASLASNSFCASFISEKEKQHYLNMLQLFTDNSSVEAKQ
jgi:adenine deaminase